jgi:hypothetical protein
MLFQRNIQICNQENVNFEAQIHDRLRYCVTSFKCNVVLYNYTIYHYKNTKHIHEIQPFENLREKYQEYPILIVFEFYTECFKSSSNSYQRLSELIYNIYFSYSRKFLCLYNSLLCFD